VDSTDERDAFRWSGSGVDEQATDVKTGKVVVKVDSQYFRPAEVECVLMSFVSFWLY
jgi:GDP-D-mannose dehydratase